MGYDPANRGAAIRYQGRLGSAGARNYTPRCRCEGIPGGQLGYRWSCCGLDASISRARWQMRSKKELLLHGCREVGHRNWTNVTVYHCARDRLVLSLLAYRDQLLPIFAGCRSLSHLRRITRSNPGSGKRVHRLGYRHILHYNPGRPESLRSPPFLAVWIRPEDATRSIQEGILRRVRTPAQGASSTCGTRTAVCLASPHSRNCE
jgi:hypothetical protein